MKEKLVGLPLAIHACCCHVHPWLQGVYMLFSHASLAEYMLLSPPSWVGVPSYCLSAVSVTCFPSSYNLEQSVHAVVTQAMHLAHDTANTTVAFSTRYS